MSEKSFIKKLKSDLPENFDYVIEGIVVLSLVYSISILITKDFASSITGGIFSGTVYTTIRYYWGEKTE